MTSSPNKGYTQPAYNSYPGTWGDELNANLTGILDNNLGGVSSVSLSNTNVTLSAAQAQNLNIFLSGTLLADVTVSSPCIGFFFVINNTTGNYTLRLQANFGAGAVGSSVVIPPGARQLIVSDTTNGIQLGAPPPSSYLPGEIKAYAGASAPTGWLLCYGQAINRKLYAALYNVIGVTYGAGDGSTTFNVPDLRGRALAGVDNMGGSDAGRLDWANAVGTVGGEQSHTLISAEMPVHSHSISDPGHAHTISEIKLFDAGPTDYGNVPSMQAVAVRVTPTTDSNTTGITVQNAGSSGSHNNMQPTMLLSYIISF